MAHTLPPSLSDPSYSPISEKMDRPRNKSHKRRSSVVSQKLELAEYKLGCLDSVCNASLMEIKRSNGITGIEFEARLKDVRNGLTTSKELLKVLNHVRGLEDRHSSTKSLISAVRVELDRARTEVDQLIRDRRSDRNETEYLVRHFAEEKAAWKRKEREKIRDAIACVAEELEVEKKLRRQTERLNKKLGKELAEAKASLSKTTKELENRTDIDEENNGNDGSPNLRKIEELEAYLKNIDIGMCQAQATKKDIEADDSADSDLHSIELTMDNNDQSYKWSYACGTQQFPVGKENKGSSDSIDWDYEDEIRRYKSVKSLRDHILSSNKISQFGSFSSPTRQWSHGGNGSPGDSKQPKAVSTTGQGRTSTS